MKTEKKQRNKLKKRSIKVTNNSCKEIFVRSQSCGEHGLFGIVVWGVAVCLGLFVVWGVAVCLGLFVV
jgi:hypothetical protein